MENEKVKQPVNFQIIQENHNNEINLYGMWQILNRYKYYLIITTVLCVVIAYIYLSTLSPVYRANAYILSPAEEDIANLNIVNLNFDDNKKESQAYYSVASVYQEYIKTFNSGSTRSLFLEQDELSFKGCVGLTITTAEDKTIKQHRGVASFSSGDAEFSAKCLNKYVGFTHRLTIDRLKYVVKEKTIVKKKVLSEEISVLREIANKNKEKAIIVLTEALEIAEKLGLTQIVITEKVVFPSVKPEGMTPSLQMEMLYRKGTMALSLELDALKNRKNNDPYTPGLIELEQEINYLDAKLNGLSGSVVNAIEIEQEATVPAPVKPKTKLIILLGLISGLMLGLFLIFLLTVFNKIREQSSNEQKMDSIQQ